MSRRNFAIDDELFDSKKEKVKRGARGDLVLSYCAIKTVFSVVPFLRCDGILSCMKKLFVAFLLFAPAFVFADVRINEIAWMGDATSAYNEWIELYNDGDTEQNLSGWTINTEDGKFSISLSKTIQPKGYFLLEHVKTDATPSTASDVLSYTGGYFNNDGGIILLLKNGDTEVQKIDAKSKWPAGNADKAKGETMQLNGTSWITASATKKAKNGTVETNPVSSGDENNNLTEGSAPAISLDASAHASPLSLSDFSQKQEIYISAGRNRIVSVGSPVTFEAYAIDAKGSKIKDVSSVWSFGDGSQAGGTKVSHTYKYPGDYAVILHASTGGNEAVSRSEVRIFSPKISLEAEDDGAISLENTSEHEINVGNWKIVGGTTSFTFSFDTIIGQGKKIIFPKDITGIDLSFSESLKLMSPCGIVFSEFVKKAKPTTVTIASTTPSELLSTIPKKNEPAAVSSASFSEPREAPVTVTSQPEKSSGIEESADREPQTITLKKPEGFLTKVWHFFFK